MSHAMNGKHSWMNMACIQADNMEESSRLEVVIKELNLRFTSGNSVPVERATIKRDEWEIILKSLTNDSDKR